MPVQAGFGAGHRPAVLAAMGSYATWSEEFQILTAVSRTSGWIDRSRSELLQPLLCRDFDAVFEDDRLSRIRRALLSRFTASPLLR